MSRTLRRGGFGDGRHTVGLRCDSQVNLRSKETGPDGRCGFPARRCRRILKRRRHSIHDLNSACWYRSPEGIFTWPQLDHGHVRGSRIRYKAGNGTYLLRAWADGGPSRQLCWQQPQSERVKARPRRQIQISMRSEGSRLKSPFAFRSSLLFAQHFRAGHHQSTSLCLQERRRVTPPLTVANTPIVTFNRALSSPMDATWMNQDRQNWMLGTISVLRLLRKRVPIILSI